MVIKGIHSLGKAN